MRLAMVAACVIAGTAAAQDTIPVTIRVDATHDIGELKPVWRFFGADEPNYAYMKDGRRLLGEIGELRPNQVYFRAHNLLTSGDGTPALKWGSTNVYREDTGGRPVYDFTIVDRIFDSYLSRGVRPYVELGFTPAALSPDTSVYQHDWRPGSGSLFTGWALPPKDYARWHDLIVRFVQHAVDRYGRSEVDGWYWETWNEANIGYWRGTREEFFRLTDVTRGAVREVLPAARVGGPHMAGSDSTYLAAFLQHALRGANPAGLDFVAFHAKGAPAIVDGHVRMGIAEQLRTMDRGFATIAAFSEAKSLPVIIGESDPEGCAACRGAQYNYRNGTMYSSYTAASFARAHDLAAKHGVNLEGVLTWAFEYEDQAFFPGFRVLADNGIDHPVMNVFRMFSRMPSRRISVESSAAIPLAEIVAQGVRERPDISAMASRDSARVAVLVWHYHDDDVPGPPARVELRIHGQAAKDLQLTEYRIDEQHSNAYALWQRMGSPVAPSGDQYRQLVAAGALATNGAVRRIPATTNDIVFTFTLPRQGVSLFVLE